MPRDESRARFRRIAAARANRVIENLRLLQNCGDRRHYSYDQEQVDKIFSAIDRMLEQTKSKFTSGRVSRVEL